MTCGECKFWGAESDSHNKYRQCHAIKHVEWPDENKDFSAFVVDGSGYFAALKCRSDFGCNLFQLKVRNETEGTG